MRKPESGNKDPVCSASMQVWQSHPERCAFEAIPIQHMHCEDFSAGWQSPGLVSQWFHTLTLAP